MNSNIGSNIDNAERIGNDGEGFLVEAMPECGGCIEIWLSGEIDLANQDRFAEVLANCLTIPESLRRWVFSPRYVLDMSRVSFLGAGGCRVIVEMAAEIARRGARTELRGISRSQRRVIELLDVQGLLRSSAA